MHHDINNFYISYTDYIQTKGNTSKSAGLLYSLSVLDSYFDSINIDFISLLFTDKGYDILMTIID